MAYFLTSIIRYTNNIVRFAANQIGGEREWAGERRERGEIGAGEGGEIERQRHG